MQAAYGARLAGFALMAAGALVCHREAVAKPFLSHWPQATQGVWVGPEFWANRLQDWRVEDGRLECVEAEKPMRTVHLLTRAVGPQAGTLEMSVRVGPAGRGSAHTWAGFLIGAGGDHVDYRLAALVHGRPAEDGGLIAAVNGLGQVVVLDNARGKRPKLAGSVKQGGDAWPASGVVRLALTLAPGQDGYTLRVAVADEAGGTLAEAVLEGIDPARLAGSLALVSHGAPGHGASGYWFREWRVSGTKVDTHEERAVGPVLCALHTLSDGVLKLTAQMFPLGADDPQQARLEARLGALQSWQTVAEATLVDDCHTFPFRVEGWDAARSASYRIAYDLRTGPDTTETRYYKGTIREEPVEGDTLVVAGFTGHRILTGGHELKWNHNGVWFPHNELVKAVQYHAPDLLFFSGDQIYEGDFSGCQRAPLDKAILDYLDKWYRWCWAFRDLARDVPCVCIPDDHDVYHGNLWGAGGRRAEKQDDGGYRMDPVFVNMVQRTQTSHLPDPADPAPVAQGIEVYFTQMDYAGVSFAILEDRKFKSSPTVMVPEANVVNGFAQNPGFDMAQNGDAAGAILLGERQLAFLSDWAADWAGGIEMKMALSQTIFANVATLPVEATGDSVVPKIPPVGPDEAPAGYKLLADADSNGWPQTGRNKALRELRRAFAFHLAGDQHLGSTVQYGIDDWNDGPFALCVPSIGNVWPRRWYPPEPGRNRKPGSPYYTGEFKDAFGNFMTVHAVSNPVISGHEPAALYDRAPGYGIVRLNKATRKITIECWPRYADPSAPGAQQYPGWPITIDQLDNYGRKAAAWLPTISVQGMTDPVVQVVDADSGEVVYTLRIKGDRFQPKVFKAGKYDVHVGEPGTSRMKVLRGLEASAVNDEMIEVAL